MAIRHVFEVAELESSVSLDKKSYSQLKVAEAKKSQKSKGRFWSKSRLKS